MPVYIDDVWATDPPVVGKIVIMGASFKSVSDEDNLIFVLRFPNKFLVNENLLRWAFGLNADQEKALYADIYVLETGSWLIDVGIVPYFDDGEFKYGDRKVIKVLSFPSEEKVILEKDNIYSGVIETESANMPRVIVSAEDSVRYEVVVCCLTSRGR
jgi:hypothetical protein